MFKKIFFSLVIISALAAGGLYFYVSQIDWNQHKTKIAEQIENITGKKVVFEGDFNLSFLPRPYLTAKNIKIFNQTGENAKTPLAVIPEMVTDLSLKPLLNGVFEINNMTLQDADVTVEFLPDGRLNWYSEISDFQRDTLNNVEVLLNSVMLKNATVRIINSGLNIDLTLNSMNAEITAQSLYGPYRIDGNFVKDNNPAGFALNLGTLSESFNTELNLALSHPMTNSHVQFEGQMLSGNKEIQGNLAVRSEDLAKFLNQMTNQVIIPLEFNYTFDGNVHLKVNPQQIDLSGLVIKYGQGTAGAGNLRIPLVPARDQERPVIEFSFDFTDLDLEPIVGGIHEQLAKYDNNKNLFEPDFDFDIIADIKAVKGTYNNEVIRNLNLNMEVFNNIASIKNFSGLFAGDTDLTVNGDIFENEKKLSYEFQVNSVSQDFLKFLTWLNFKPDTYAQSTYRNAQASFKLSGNLNQIKIAPISFTLDNNLINGVVGIVRAQRPQLFVSMQSEKINFDNYLPQFSDEDKKRSLAERIKKVLNQMHYFNDYDIHLESKLNIGIYNKTPFENLEINLDSKDGTVTLNKLNIGELAASELSLKGNVMGLGSNPRVENLKYEFTTKDFAAFKNTLDLPLPQWPLFANARNVKASGILSGNSELINIKAVTNLDNSFFRSVYTGKLFNQGDKFNFRGKLEFKTDFVKFIKSLGFDYRPKAFASGVFTFQGIVSGNKDDWNAKNIDAFISTSNIKGNFGVQMTDGIPFIRADLQTNRFEFDRLIYNPTKQVQRALNPQSTQSTFLEKPALDVTAIDYELYKKFKLNAKIQADVLNYEAEEFSNAKADIEIADNKIIVKNFNALYGRKMGEKSPLTGQIEIDLVSDPRAKGFVNIENYIVNNLGGDKYAVESGTLKARLDFDTFAFSQAAFLENLSGKLSFDIDKAKFKGWNLQPIEDDLMKRDTSDNLLEFVTANLEKGVTPFDIIGSEINFDKGEYTLSNTLFSSVANSVEATGKGNLREWNTDLDFVASFDRINEKTPPVRFNWKGNLSNPALSVNVEEIQNKYDSYWAQVAREKKEAEDARLKALNAAMDEAQDIVYDLKVMAQKEIRPLIEKYKPLSFNMEVKSIYDSNLIQLNDIQNQLEIMEKKAQDEFTIDEVNEMKAKLDVFNPQLVEILRVVRENVVKDTKLHVGDTYNNMINIYDNSREKFTNYQKTLDAYVLRLLQLNSMIVLDRDPRASDLKRNIEASLKKIEDARAQANEIKDIVIKSENLDEINLKYTVLQEVLKKSQQELENLNQNLEDLFSYAQKLVREEEKNQLQVKPVAQQTETPKTDAVVVKDNEKEQMPKQEKLPTEKQNAEVEKTMPAEKTAVEMTPEPLMKEIKEKEGNVVTYSSKIKVSGKISKTSAPKDSAKETAKPSSAGGLLRMLEPSEKTEKSGASGSIVRKK